MVEKRKTQIKFTYELNKGMSCRVDKKIVKIVKALGGKWLSQKVDEENNERELCFSMEI